MLLKSIKLGIGILAAMLICGQASAQYYGALGGAGVAGDNCGRGITDSQAASLWAGYCTETCGYYGGSAGGSSYAGSSCGGEVSYGDISCGDISCGDSSCDVAPVHSGCKLFGGGMLRGLLGGGGCGCDQGGFGYPSDCCGGDVFGGGYAGGYGGLSYSASSCDTSIVSGGCGLFGGCRLRGRGTGLFARLFSRSGGGCCLSRNLAPSYSVNYVPVTFQASASQCGANNAYFDEFIGPEYGTTGMQSSVSGCATGACGASSYDGGFDLGGAPDMGYSGGHSQGAVDYGQQSYEAGADFGMGKSVVDGQVQNIVGEAITDALQGTGN